MTGDHIMTSEITTPAANVELVRAGFQAFNAGDADECLARIARRFRGNARGADGGGQLLHGAQARG
jgi:hypothetical protein